MLKLIMKTTILILILTIVSCKNNQPKKLITSQESPYELFFNELEIENLSDTILVPIQTRIFGCGTGYTQYQENLVKKGLNKFYEKYGDVLSNTLAITKFETKNKTKILWITRGNEGELNELFDSFLHKKLNFEKRIMESKNYVSLTETPFSMDSLIVDISVNEPISKKFIQKTYSIFKVNEKWKLNKIIN